MLNKLSVVCAIVGLVVFCYGGYLFAELLAQPADEKNGLGMALVGFQVWHAATMYVSVGLGLITVAAIGLKLNDLPTKSAKS